MYANEERTLMWHSIFGPKLKVIKATVDPMEATVECNRCGAHVVYGTSMFMVNGKHYCIKCQEAFFKSYNKGGE